MIAIMAWFWDAKSIFLVAGVAVMATAGFTISSVLGSGDMVNVDDRLNLPGNPVENYSADFDYYPENETIQIELETPVVMGGSSLVVIVRGGNETHRPAVVRADRTVENGYWVSNNISSATDYPLKPGDQLTVVSDGDDEDGDGNLGIENGDIVKLYWLNSTVHNFSLDGFGSPRYRLIEPAEIRDGRIVPPGSGY